MPPGRQTVERRQLGLMLRRLREQAVKTQQEAARAIGRNAARISQVETAKGSFSLDELTALLDLYEVGESERDIVLTLGSQTRRRQHGGSYVDQLPRSFERTADLQADAKSIGFYETGIVPGLAQSRDYVAAMIRSGDGVWWDSDEDEIERRIAFRLHQQDRVLEASEPKEIAFLITETALDQVVGSTAVLRGQLLHLLQLSERTNVTVQVIPFSVPNNPLLGGGLITLDFGETAPKIALNAANSPTTYHDHESETGPMFSAFRLVQTLALAQKESRGLLLSKMEGVQ